MKQAPTEVVLPVISWDALSQKPQKRPSGARLAVSQNLPTTAATDHRKPGRDPKEASGGRTVTKKDRDQVRARFDASHVVVVRSVLRVEYNAAEIII